MDRRTFLGTCLASAGLGAAACRESQPPSVSPYILTVNGPIDPTDLGKTLPHEHVLVDFIGADQVSSDRYNPDEVFELVLPYLEQVRNLGCQSLFECTPAFLGRDPTLLRRLSEASGLHLITNTGYYGAAGDLYIPHFAFTETADELATRWVREFEEGLEGTGVRPGFIKIGVDGETLSDIDRKLVVAAARAHTKTGLTIAAHTGPAALALEQLQILESEGVDPSAWIWVHAQVDDDMSMHVYAGERGGWVEFDGISLESVERHVAMVVNMKEHGLLRRVLVSHDAGWYHVDEAGGGTFRPFDTLFNEFLPALDRAGCTDDDIDQLLVTNPAEAFTVQTRIT